MKGDSRRTIRESHTLKNKETTFASNIFGRVAPFIDPTTEAKIAKVQRPLNRFDVFGAIGSGGCAIVHLGSNEGEFVAIKKVNNSIRDPEQISAANNVIKNEFDLMKEIYARVQETAIKPISLIENNHENMLIMELVLYPTVEVFVRIARLSEVEKAALLIECSSSLQKIHENGIIHRDIKESNLFIADNGVKVGDLGTAQIEGKEDKVKRYFERVGVIGSDIYRAPEIDVDNITHLPGEIYAFGIMMYRIFAGKSPFTLNQREAILKWHKEGKAPEINSPVWAVIERCLRKNPTERPGSIVSIGDEIGSSFEKVGLKIPKFRD